MIRLQILDPATIEILNDPTDFISKTLSYKYEWWVQGPHHKIKKERMCSFIFGRKRKYFYAGFINKIKLNCTRYNIPIEISGEISRPQAVRSPFLKNEKLRNIQIDGILKINQGENGILNLGTGIGKTKLIAGLLSTYNNPRMLFLCRSKDILNQTYETFTNCGYKCSKVGAGQKDLSGDIVVAIAQSYVKLDLIKLSNSFDIVCVDEAHLGLKAGTQYEKILKICLAPIRLGLTATIPQKEQDQLIMEGLLGPSIIQADANYGIRQGLLVKPKIEFLGIPEKKELKDISGYKNIYDAGIVNNGVRNNIICNTIEKEINKNHSGIIFCVEIEHIDNISSILLKNGIKHEVVHGKIEDREEIKKDLTEKKNLVVISSVVWTAGIDIPTLDYIIDATSGKSPEGLLQKIGRGLRISDDKSEAIVYICLDCGRYLAEHTVRKLLTLKNMKWI